jgi:hypothetical protein
MNRKGSRYCSSCGERLDTVPSTHCPSCNAPNLASREYCAFCGASLEPPAEPSEVGVPTPASAEETFVEEAESEPLDAEALPDWLYDLSDEEEAVAVPEAEGAAVPEQKGLEPNRHLQGISGVLPSIDGWLARSLERHLAVASDSDEPPDKA